MKNSREEELINQRLAAFEEDPSNAVWDRIAVAIPQTVPTWTIITEFTTTLLVVGMMVLTLNIGEPVASDGIVSTEIASTEGVEKEMSVENGVAEDTRRSRGGYAEEPPAIPPLSPFLIDNDSVSTPVLNSDAPDDLTSAYPLQPLRILRDTTASNTADSSTLQPIENPDEIITPKRKTTSRLRFYASITPSLSFQKIIPGTNDNIIVQGMAATPSLSMKRFGFGLDLGVQHQLTKTLSVYGGFSLYRQQQQLTYYYSDGMSEVTRIGDTWSFEVFPAKHEKTFDYNMTNVGAQAGLIATVNSHLLIHQFGSGLKFEKGIGAGRSDEVYVNSGSQYMMWQIFYRNEFVFSEKYSLFVQPNFSYGILSSEKIDIPFKMKPYRAGITIGLLLRRQ